MPADAARAQRVRAVREAARMTQAEFATRLTEIAHGLYGAEAPVYRQATVAKIETQVQALSLEDLAVIAHADPRRRGMLWLGWQASHDATIRGPSTTELAAATGATVRTPGPPAEDVLPGTPHAKPAAKEAGGRRRA